MTHYRQTVAVVDLDAIRHNVRALKPAGAELMAVVKANAYGHGDVAVARAALEAGATWLGVAGVEEGVRLREAGLAAPILVLTEFPPGSEKEALSAGLTPSLYTRHGLEALASAAEAAGRVVGPPPGVHVKVDTGMHRVGMAPETTIPFVRGAVDAGLGFEGLWTHFAKAEEPDDPSVAAQLQRFLEASASLDAAGLRPSYRHAANSAAAMSNPATHFDLVRIGVAMYGLSPGPALDGAAGMLRPALSWRSAVALAKRVAAGEGVSYGLRYRAGRETTIATVPVGYADGYRRSLSETAYVLIRGSRYPVAGTISMDQTTVDCGDDQVEPGDEVILLGSQGSDRITAEQLAGWAGTINYEIACGIGERVPRHYVEAVGG